ncbi:MAG: dihydroorotate dehydrogenase electron transfer subunit [Caldisericota bacterium]|nr:dihydroorotate dehydrogenase electron transfer subunit [Caldisericota bacterium]
MENPRDINSILTKGKIIEQVNLSNNYHKIKIKAPQIPQEAKPGQFVMLSKWKIKELFLKRPFSFYNIEPNLGTFDILYKNIGKGTQILAESKIGDLVELIGPLGNGFNIPENTRKVAVVARGIGVAPLIPLMLESKKRGIEIYSFLSAQTENLLLCSNKIESISRETFYTTDDGTKGAKGKVTGFLEKILKEIVVDVVYTCGSKRLAKHIRNLQKKYNFLAFVSLEEHMACGIGTCKGCVRKTKYGYKRVCKEGPVFPVEEVIFND